MQQPADLTLAIMEQRAFARAWEMVNNTEDASKLPDNLMIDMVWQVRDQQVKEERERRRAKAEAKAKQDGRT